MTGSASARTPSLLEHAPAPPQGAARLNVGSSWEAFGKSYDQYGTGGGWQKWEELFDGLLNCDSSRVYVSQRVRRAAPMN